MSETKDPFSESDFEEENVVTTGGDQFTDQGNLDEKNKSFSTTHGEPERVQGYEEKQDLNLFQFFGKGTENLDSSNPLNLRTSENVFSGGVRRETSVVSPISQGQQSMSPKQLHKELEDKAATEKTVMDEKLDLILEEIRNQKLEVKALSETVKTVQKQT